MSLDEFATEIESQTCSCNFTGACILRSYEAPKNTCMLTNRNTHASISNRQDRFVWLDFFTKRQFDWSPLWAIFYGIA